MLQNIVKSHFSVFHISGSLGEKCKICKEYGKFKEIGQILSLIYENEDGEEKLERGVLSTDANIHLPQDSWDLTPAAKPNTISQT